MLLKTQGIVRLATDVTIRYSQSGSAIASFSVVSSEKYKTQSGDSKENTAFVDVVAFSRLGEICNQYIKKGSRIFIEGRIQQDKWTAKDGTNRSKHTIKLENMEMLDGKPQPQQNNNDDPNRHNIAGNMNKPTQQHQAQEDRGCANPNPTHATQGNYSEAKPQQGGALPDMPTDDEIPFAPLKIV